MAVTTTPEVDQEPQKGTFICVHEHFGFINVPDGPDMFVLPSACEAFGGVLPPTGTEMTFEVVTDARTGRPRAVHCQPRRVESFGPAESTAMGACSTDEQDSNAAPPVGCSVPATEVQSVLAVGSEVSLQGLKGSPQLNGSEGTCLSFDETKGRWLVLLTNGNRVLLKPDDLVAAGRPADKPAEEPKDEPAEKPGDEPTGKPAGKDVLVLCCTWCSDSLELQGACGQCVTCEGLLCADCSWICGYCDRPACRSHVPHEACRPPPPRPEPASRSLSPSYDSSDSSASGIGSSTGRLNVTCPTCGGLFPATEFAACGQCGELVCTPWCLSGSRCPACWADDVQIALVPSPGAASSSGVTPRPGPRTDRELAFVDDEGLATPLRHFAAGVKSGVGSRSEDQEVDLNRRWIRRLLVEATPFLWVSAEDTAKERQSHAVGARDPLVDAVGSEIEIRAQAGLPADGAFPDAVFLTAILRQQRKAEDRALATPATSQDSTATLYSLRSNRF